MLYPETIKLIGFSGIGNPVKIQQTVHYEEVDEIFTQSGIAQVWVPGELCIQNVAGDFLVSSNGQFFRWGNPSETHNWVFTFKEP